MLHPTPTTPRLHRLNAIVIYVTQPVGKINYTKASKGYGQGARKVELEKYHRFVVLGVPGSSAVIAMFTPNSETSRNLFRYDACIRIGSEVTIIKPTVEGQQARGGTPLIATRGPLVPASTISAAVTLPPYDVEKSSLEFKFFLFVTKDLIVDSAVIAENVCAGSFCDGQTFHEPCGCVEAGQTKTWVLLLEFTYPELNENVNSDETLSIYSSFLVTDAVRNMKADSGRIDRFRLDAQIQTLVAAINSADGFRIQGWFKPASDDDGTAVEHKKFHVTSLTPATDLSEDQRQLKYAGEPAAA